MRQFSAAKLARLPRRASALSSISLKPKQKTCSVQLGTRVECLVLPRPASMDGKPPPDVDDGQEEKKNGLCETCRRGQGHDRGRAQQAQIVDGRPPDPRDAGGRDPRRRDQPRI